MRTVNTLINGVTSGKVLSGPNVGALTLAAALIFGVYILMRLSQDISAPGSTPLVIRSVELAVSPPPPPPPPQQQNRIQQNLSLDLTVESAGPALEVAPINMEESLDLIAPSPPTLSLQSVEWSRDLSVDWSAFSLDELDALPQVVALQDVTFPNELSRRNVHRVVIRLDIFIDETGRVSLMNVIENPYPGILDQAIRRIVETTRFTAPTRGGAPVRARFIWPVEIQE